MRGGREHDRHGYRGLENDARNRGLLPAHLTIPVGVRRVEDLSVVPAHKAPKGGERWERGAHLNQSFRHTGSSEQTLFHRSISNPPERVFVLAGSLESTENSGEVSVVVEAKAKVDRLDDPPVVIIFRAHRKVPTTYLLGPDPADSLGDNRGVVAHGAESLSPLGRAPDRPVPAVFRRSGDGLTPPDRRCVVGVRVAGRAGEIVFFEHRRFVRLIVTVAMPCSSRAVSISQWT